jgi:hypothetical protein
MSKYNIHITLFFIILMSLPLGLRMGFITHFVLQKEYIIAKHCVNKEAPQLKCDGKCHLRKFVNIQKEEEPLEEAPQFPISSLEEIFSFLYIPNNLSTKVFVSYRLLDIFQEKSIYCPFKNQVKGRIYQMDLLRPPSFLI